MLQLLKDCVDTINANLIGSDHDDDIYIQCLVIEARERKLNCTRKPATYVRYKGELVGVYETDLCITDHSTDATAYVLVNCSNEEKISDLKRFNKEQKQNVYLILADFHSAVVKLI